METICKALETETSTFLCVVKYENDNVKYAITDEELENENLKLPKVVEDIYLEDEEKIIGKYKHFKGNDYEVLGISYNLSGEKYVLYKALYENDIKFFIRPYEMFFEKVDRKKYPDAIQEYRFQKYSMN